MQRMSAALLSALVMTSASLAASYRPVQAAGASCPSNWTAQKVQEPKPASGYIMTGQLTGASFISGTSGWAVGFWQENAARGAYDGPYPLAERWNGTAWKIVPVPAPNNSVGTLGAVVDITATNAWALGEGGVGSTGQLIIDHWNGSAWSAAASVTTGFSTPVINAAGRAGSNDIWAVGSLFDDSVPGGMDRPYVEQYNGTGWSQLATPSNATGEFTAIRMLSASDVWLAADARSSGTTSAVWHWTPTGGFQEVLPMSAGARVTGIAGSSDHDIWIAGNDASNNGIVQHFDGSAWHSQTIQPAGSTYASLASILEISASDVWAVGDYSTSTTNTSYVAHWNGSSWSVATPFGTTGNGMTLFRSASQIVAVGDPNFVPGVWAHCP